MNKKIVLSFLIFVLLLVSLGMATVLVQKRQEIRKKAAADYTASLSLSRIDVSLGTGETFPLDIILDPGGQTVVGVDVILNFDKTLLEIINLVPALDDFETFAPVQGNGSPDLEDMKSEANTTGKLEFGAVSFNWGSGEIGGVSTIINPLMTIAFRAKAAGEDTITFGFDGLGQTTDSNVIAISGEEVVDILQDISGNTTAVTIFGGATVTPTPELTPTPTSALTPTPTPTTSPETGNLRFQIRFQGINGAQPATMEVVGILKQGVVEKHSFENILVENDGTGKFVDMFRDIPAGTYDVFIKGPSHLQKGFCGVTFIAGQTVEKDWTDDEFLLLVGDFLHGDPPVYDNVLNIMDIADILRVYTALSVPVDGTNRIYDVDGSEFIDISDIALVFSNYTVLSREGDEICE